MRREIPLPLPVSSGSSDMNVISGSKGRCAHNPSTLSSHWQGGVEGQDYLPCWRIERAASWTPFDTVTRIDHTSHQHQDKVFILGVSESSDNKEERVFARCFKYQEMHTVRAPGSLLIKVSVCNGKGCFHQSLTQCVRKLDRRLFPSYFFLTFHKVSINQVPTDL